ncbi:type II secretion system protein [Enterobacter chuandaensis]
MRNGENGFTLIELLVVMAIIATLMTLVAPRFFSQTERAKQIVQEHNLHALHAALDAFRRDRLIGPDTLDDLVQEGYLRKLPLDPVSNRSDTWQIVTDETGQIIDITIPDTNSWAEDHDW